MLSVPSPLTLRLSGSPWKRLASELSSFLTGMLLLFAFEVEHEFLTTGFGTAAGVVE